MAKSPSQKAFHQFLESIDKFGSADTMKILEKGALEMTAQIRERIEFVVKSVCTNFELSRAELLNSRTLITRTDAIAVLFFICNQMIQLEPADIKSYFSKSLSNISRGIKRIRELDAKIPQDRKLQVKLLEIQEAYKQYLQENDGL